MYLFSDLFQQISNICTITQIIGGRYLSKFVFKDAVKVKKYIRVSVGNIKNKVFLLCVTALLIEILFFPSTKNYGILLFTDNASKSL